MILKKLIQYLYFMISEKENKRISKFLSYVLRHHPETIDIRLDENGWADVDQLLERSGNHGFPIDRATLLHIVDTNAKKRFAFNESADKIRANQGHSIEIELNLKPQQPPDILFHGTKKDAVEMIMETGLEKRSRNHVHLSQDMPTAVAVGQRHGKPFVFEVLASDMFKDDHVFFLSDNGVWLTDHVPAKYLRKPAGNS